MQFLIFGIVSHGYHACTINLKNVEFETNQLFLQLKEKHFSSWQFSFYLFILFNIINQLILPLSLLQFFHIDLLQAFQKSKSCNK